MQVMIVSYRIINIIIVLAGFGDSAPPGKYNSSD